MEVAMGGHLGKAGARGREQEAVNSEQ
ncbi:hypothetical protein SBDP2_780003 [Syntrophobacter sp. SbD2]|nr:hypothetical protein SBDP2_780003 [Syntrophobacter sp. SbD2]